MVSTSRQSQSTSLVSVTHVVSMMMLHIAVAAISLQTGTGSADAVDLLLSESVRMEADKLQAVLLDDKMDFLGEGRLKLEDRPVFKIALDGKRENTPLVRIVQMGSGAIARLCRHLRDQRPTRLTLDHVVVNATFLDKGPSQAGEVADSYPDSYVKIGEISMKSYQVRVGDLCLFLLGQITNRYYVVFRSYGPGEYVVNSPTLNRPLAESVSRQWKDVSARVLLDSLVRDAVSPDLHYRDGGAIRRIKKFYPRFLDQCVKDRLALETAAPGTSSARLAKVPGSFMPYNLTLGFWDALSDVGSGPIDEATEQYIATLRKRPDLADRAGPFALGATWRLSSIPRFEALAREFCESRIGRSDHDSSGYRDILRFLDKGVARRSTEAWFGPGPSRLATIQRIGHGETVK